MYDTIPGVTAKYDAMHTNVSTTHLFSMRILNRAYLTIVLDFTLPGNLLTHSLCVRHCRWQAGRVATEKHRLTYGKCQLEVQERWFGRYIETQIRQSAKKKQCWQQVYRDLNDSIIPS